MPGKYPFTDAPFGAVSPYLMVSRKHNIPYETVLGLADYATHGRDIDSKSVSLLFHPHNAEFRKDFEAVMNYWYPVFHALDAGTPAVI
jgi:hypothetical protein